MKINLLLITVVLLSSLAQTSVSQLGQNSSSRAEYKRTLKKTFDVSGTLIVNVENSFGPINITGTKTSKATVEVIVTATGSSKESAKNTAKSVNILLEGTKSTLVIKAAGLGSPEDDSKGYDIAISITIPESSIADVKNTFGSTTIHGIEGDIKFEGKHGSLEIVGGRNIKVRNEFGSIHVAKPHGAVSLVNSHGEIQCHEFNGGVIQNKFGSVEVSNPRKFVRIHVEMGSVEVHGMRSGRIDCNYGSVDIKLSDKFSGKIEALSRFGSVENSLDIPVESEGQSSFIEGSVGAGKDDLTVRCEFGSISITQ